MRRGFSDQKIIRNKAGDPIGICLGWSFSGEHYAGIGDIERDFGVTERRVTLVPEGLKFFKRGAYSYLVYRPEFVWQMDGCTKRELDALLELTPRSQEDFSTARQRFEFGIRMKGSKTLKKIYDALLAKDVLIYWASKHTDP